MSREKRWLVAICLLQCVVIALGGEGLIKVSDTPEVTMVSGTKSEVVDLDELGNHIDEVLLKSSDSRQSLPEGCDYLSEMEALIVDDVSLETIVDDARAYVEDYYDAAADEMDLGELPVIIYSDRINVRDGEYTSGVTYYITETGEVAFIVLSLEEIMVCERYPKHVVFWTMVHEYVHCARLALGEQEKERSEEEGETMLITALIVKGVIGEDSDIGWYVNGIETQRYKEWAEEAALRQGIEVPWD